MEMLLNYLKGLLVYVHILVTLEELYLIQAVALLHEDSVRVHAEGAFRFLLAELQYVLDTIESNLDYLDVTDGEQVAQVRDAVLKHTG